jgi:histidine transport system permease protein
MLLNGYGWLIAIGTLQTLKVALLSLLLAFNIGLLAAAAKLSGHYGLCWCATLYTTVLRSIPNLVLMLLIYFSLQIWLNSLTEALSRTQIEIPALSAAVISLGVCHGAYFTETIRGAILAVDRGQLDAAHAFGMTRSTIWRRILFPQMMHHALPGLSNNWLVLLKSTAPVSLLGLNDMVLAARQAGDATGRQFFFFSLIGAVFLGVSTMSQLVLQRMQHRYSRGTRKSLPC